MRFIMLWLLMAFANSNLLKRELCRVALKQTNQVSFSILEIVYPLSGNGGKRNFKMQIENSKWQNRILKFTCVSVLLISIAWGEFGRAFFGRGFAVCGRDARIGRLFVLE